ncbi:hypothetical protein BX616_005305, partial [Lobosporangium transversale]
MVRIGALLSTDPLHSFVIFKRIEWSFIPEGDLKEFQDLLEQSEGKRGTYSLKTWEANVILRFKVYEAHNNALPMNESESWYVKNIWNILLDLTHSTFVKKGRFYISFESTSIQIGVVKI